MLKLILSFVLVVLMIPLFSSATISNYSVEYSIQSSYDVQESIYIVFSEPLNNSGTFHLILGSVSNLVVIADKTIVPSRISKQDQSYLVSFNLSSGVREIILTFLTKDLVFRSEDNFNFFTLFDAGPSTKQFSATVWLPQGHSIFRDLILPKNSQKLTDGKKIGLRWSFEEVTQSIPISVRFEKVINEERLSFVFIGILIGIPILFIILIFGYYRFTFRKKTQEAFFKGFLEDEVKIIKFLQEKKEIKQSIIEKEFGFSRAKVTRSMKKLEEKELITKEKLGRTNRICWVGGN